MNRTDSQLSPFSSGHVDHQILDDLCNDKIVIDYIDNVGLVKDFLKALKQHNPTIRWGDGSSIPTYTPTDLHSSFLHIPLAGKHLYHDDHEYMQAAYPHKQIVPIADAFICTDSPDTNAILELLP